jgi:hypothetical protein
LNALLMITPSTMARAAMETISGDSASRFMP